MRILTGFLSCALALSQVATLSHATEGSELVGQLLLPENSVISVEESQLSLHRYAPEVQEKTDTTVPSLLYYDPWYLETYVSNILPDTKLEFRALTDDVWVYVQYLTDINGDGNYEWVVDSTYTPSWDMLSKMDTLAPSSQAASWFKMKAGQVRTLEAGILFNRGLAIEASRAPDGYQPLEGLDFNSSGEIIYCITFSDVALHGENPPENAPMQSYYLKVDSVGFENPTILGAYTFTDVVFGDVYFDAVDYCVRSNLMTGTSLTEFSPGENQTRAEILDCLYDMHGAPNVVTRSFSDIDKEAWYASAFTWAVNRGIAGAENGAFRPNDYVTREEFYGFLYNYASSTTKLGSTTGSVKIYNDYEEISSRQESAILWAVDVGLLEENEDGNILPKAVLNRGEIAMILADFAVLIA